MIKLILTGGSGMIGTRLTNLIPDDIKIVANIDRNQGLDILNLPKMKQALSGIKADAVIHLAAFTNVTAAAKQEGNKNGSCFQINVTGTKNVIALAEYLKCRLIHISTDFIFDGTAAQPYTENSRPHPIEWYGTTKFEAEKLVQNSSLDWCIARTAYPFVASFPQKLDLVRSRIVKLTNHTLPPQFTDHHLTPTFTDELARALITLTRRQATGIYHLVGADILTDFAIATAIAATFGFDSTAIEPSSIDRYNQTALRPYQKYLGLSNNKFQKKFGPHFSPFKKALHLMKKQGINIQNHV